jgi:ribose transport system substrate-binding protein
MMRLSGAIRSRARWLAAGLVLALFVAISACSSGGSTGSTTTSGTSGSSGQAAAQAKAAAGKLTSVEVPPTKITLTTPLPKAPPKGLMVWMNCDIPACTVIGNGVKAAVTAAGWKFAIETYTSANPATLTAAMTRALALHPSAVTLSGIPAADGWASVEPAYKAAGVPIIPMFLGPTQLNSTVIANIGGPPARQTTAVTMAQWFIANSGGKGHALLQRVDGFPIVKVWSDTFASTVAAECSECTVTDLSNTIADASDGGIVPSIIPDLVSHPSINYLFGDLEFYDGLPAAMKAANLTGKVKIAGETPDIIGEDYLKQGVFSAATPAGNNYAGWLAADAAFRYIMHLPIPAADSGYLPYQLLFPNTSFVVNPGYTMPTDYPQQFEALWKVG